MESKILELMKEATAKVERAEQRSREIDAEIAQKHKECEKELATRRKQFELEWKKQNEERSLALTQKEKELMLLEEKLKKEATMVRNQQLLSEKKIKLDVGGKHFSTSLTTLTSVPDSMLSAMFSGRFPLDKDSDQNYFIDRNGEIFGWILDWLRDKSLPHHITRQHQLQLINEAGYYGLTKLETELKLQFDNAKPQSRTFDFTHQVPWAFKSSDITKELIDDLKTKELIFFQSKGNAYVSYPTFFLQKTIKFNVSFYSNRDVCITDPVTFNSWIGCIDSWCRSEFRSQLDFSFEEFAISDVWLSASGFAFLNERSIATRMARID